LIYRKPKSGLFDDENICETKGLRILDPDLFYQTRGERSQVRAGKNAFPSPVQRLDGTLFQFRLVERPDNS
jgi:hypothetical protein